MINYIFSINTGRSGSHYVSRLFEHVEQCVSTHEPQPVMNGAPMREYLRGNPQALRRKMPDKIRSIKTIRSGHDVYVETNHCFIKGFGWLLSEHIDQSKIGIIDVRRDADSTINSLLRIGCTPLLKSGDDWIVTPDALLDVLGRMKDPHFSRLQFQCYRILRRSLFRPGVLRYVRGGKTDWTRPRFIYQYERRMLAWYLEATRVLALAYRERFPQIRYYEVDIESLNEWAYVIDMLDFFGLKPKSSLQDVIGHSTNRKIKKEAGS